MTQKISIARSPNEGEPKSSPAVHVNAAVVIAFMLQTATAFMWAGAAENRIGQLEERVQTREQFFERTARLEENVEAMRASLDRVERKLDIIQQEQG